MRVNDPLMYGEKLLSIVLPKENYTAERLRKMFGGSEININFPTNIPVHLTYQSAYVDDAGKLVIREDIYGRDAPHDRGAEGLRAPGRRHPDGAAEGELRRAGAGGAGHLRRRRGSRRSVVLRPAVRRAGGDHSRAEAAAQPARGLAQLGASDSKRFHGRACRPAMIVLGCPV